MPLHRRVFAAWLLVVVVAACGGGDGVTTTGPFVPSTIDTTRGLVLDPIGLRAVPFGADPDAAVAAVADLLGRPPDVDTGWIDPFSDYGTCPGSEIRAAEWGDLTLLFTDGESEFAPAGRRHFFSYTYRTGNRGPDGLRTQLGIGLGSSVAALQDAYGPDLAIKAETIEDVAAGGPRYEIAYSRGLLSGFVAGTGPDESVLAIDGGVGCGR
jgi:hypothetical protein